MELCGNFLDNVCKVVINRIIVLVMKSDGWLIIKVEDDGFGIFDDKKVFLLEWGIWFDIYIEGYGIGMVLVVDLVLIYEGRMFIEDSLFGGVCIVI